MKQIITLTLLLTTLALPAFAGTAPSRLTGKTLIDGDVVTVGDLFTNAAGNANHALAPAPQIGAALVLKANDLQRVANAFKLNWKATGTETVALERNATAVTAEDITKALAESELKTQISDDAQFKVTNLNEDIIVPGQSEPELKIGATTFNEKTDAFTAELIVLHNDTVIKTVTLNGLATPLAQIPVLKYTMASNTPITAQDLTEISVPKKQLRSDMITSKNELIGMTPKRSLQGNQTILRKDVNPPIMVKRNDIVTIIYKNGPIELSSKARALGAGATGDSVMMMNTTSKKSFEAKVTGPQQAEVNLNG
jgi:flagellar basal body P-ring formation protein FlgA